MASLLADITPLRHSRNFRRLWFGLAVTSIGSQLTVVADGRTIGNRVASGPAVESLDAAGTAVMPD